MSMSHEMINPCQLKIQIILPGARHHGWIYFITLLWKYERLMGHFSRKYDRDAWWNENTSNWRHGIQPERFSSARELCVSAFSIMMMMMRVSGDVTMSRWSLAPDWGLCGDNQTNLLIFLLISVNFLWFHINIDTWPCMASLWFTFWWYLLLERL